MDIPTPPALIPALDINLTDAVKLVRQLKPVEGKIACYKVSSLHSLDQGLRATVAELRTVTKKPIIYDHQKGATDIPAIVEKQVEVAAKCGVDSFIGVPLGAGEKTLEAFVQACKSNNILPIILLEMSHPGATSYLKLETARKVFDEAVELGVEYLVGPATKPDQLKLYRGWIEETGATMYLTSPGIGAQGGSCLEAVKNGTDFPIIGRAITQADDPVKAVEQFFDDSVEGFAQRE